MSCFYDAYSLKLPVTSDISKLTNGLDKTEMKFPMERSKVMPKIPFQDLLQVGKLPAS